jgi:hypothetical protein
MSESGEKIPFSFSLKKEKCPCEGSAQSSSKFFLSLSFLLSLFQFRSQLAIRFLRFQIQ